MGEKGEGKEIQDGHLTINQKCIVVSTLRNSFLRGKMSSLGEGLMEWWT